MPTYGPRTSTFEANVTIGSDFDWENLALVRSQDGNKANTKFTIPGGESSSILRTAGFGFTIPTNEVIVGLEFTWYRNASAEFGTEAVPRIYKNGISAGSMSGTYGNAWPDTPSSRTQGGPTDMHGLSWTPAEINNSGFGFGLWGDVLGDPTTLNIDYMAITVYTVIPDVTAPAVTGVVVDNVLGDNMVITFDENVANSTGFSLTADGGAVSLGSPVVSNDTITFTLGRSVFADEAVLLNYAPGNVEDTATAPNALAAFTDLPVNVTAAVTRPSTSIVPDTWFCAQSGVLDAGDALASDGEAVATWMDLSTNNNHAVQASGPLQPIYDAEVTDFNNKPAINFPSNDYLVSPATTEPRTILVFGDCDTSDTGIQTWVGGKRSAGGSTGAYWFQPQTLNTPRVMAFTRVTDSDPLESGATDFRAFMEESQSTADGVNFSARGDLVGRDPVRVDPSAAPEGQYLMPVCAVARHNGPGSGGSPATIELRLNGFEVAYDKQDDTETTLRVIGETYIGAGYFGGVGDHFKGNIFEIMIFDTRLTDAQVETLEQEVAARWTIANPNNNTFTGMAWLSDAIQQLYLLTGDDGINFTATAVSITLPRLDVTRDPSIVYDPATDLYILAYTTRHWSQPETYVNIAKSRDMRLWSHVTSLVTGAITDPRAWAPELFRDSDGSINLLLAVANAVGGPHELQLATATDSTYANWSSLTALTGTAFAGGHLDGMVFKINGKYHLWFTDRSLTPWNNVLATSDALGGPYTLDATLQGDWLVTTGDGSVEGPYLVHIGGRRWRVYFDQPGTGIKLASPNLGQYMTSSDNMKTWVTGTTIEADNAAGTRIPRHLSMLKNIRGPAHVVNTRKRATTQGQGLFAYYL